MNSALNPIVNMPYPKIENIKKDISFAYKLLEVYAGEVSELTSLGQYTFQSTYLKDYKDLSKILESISMVEMKHMEMLGKLIMELGLIPYYVTYQDNNPIPWNSDYINFTIDYRKMLLSNLECERKTADKYESLIDETDDINVKEILNRIVIDEKRHIEVLSTLLEQYDSDE